MATKSLFGFEVECKLDAAVETVAAECKEDDDDGGDERDGDGDGDGNGDGNGDGDGNGNEDELSIACKKKKTKSDFLEGDIVMIKFRESPYLGFVKELCGMKAKIIPLRESDAETCSWVKAGNAVTKAAWECIKLPARLADMKICI